MQRFIVGLVIFGVAQVFVFVSAYCYWVMLAEVNRKLPDDAQISYFWGNFVKSERIEAEYRRLYPSGRLIRYSRAAFAVGAILGLLSAFVAGFFDAFLVGPK